MRTPLTAVLLSAIVISGCQPQVGTDRWQGYIEAEPLYAASAVAGPLLQVPLQPGQQLQPGDLLFVLDPAPYLAAVAEAQALLAQAAAQRDDLALGARSEELAVLEARQQQAVAALALAKAQFDRQQQLLARSLTSREAFDQAKANLDSQRQQLAGAEAALASARLAGRDDAQRAAAAAVDAATARLQQAQWLLSQSRQQAQEPDLGALFAALGGQVRLLQGGVEQIQGHALGQLLLSVSGMSVGAEELRKRAQHWAQHVEVIGYGI